MNITKNKLIEALEYLGEFPKTSQKKDELMNQLNEVYNEKIDQFTIIINTKIYNLLKMLVQAKEEYVEVKEKYESEVDFLKSILLIDEPIYNNNKIYIKFYEGMREKIARFINKKNEENVKKNQILVNLMLNMVEVYGIIKDYEMLDIFNKMLNVKMGIESIYALIHYQIDLRSEIIITEINDAIYFMNCLMQYPEDIIEEREKRDLYYKEYTIQELDKYKLENLIECKEAEELIKFIENKEIEYSEEFIFSIILYIMNTPQIKVEDLMEPMQGDLNDIDEANEYLQLVMQLHNNIPHYALYGYTPMDLVKMQIEEKTDNENNKKKKVGRNEPCPCRKWEEI